METLIKQIKRIWPQACWSVSVYENNKHVGYVSNGQLFGSKKFVSGWAEARTPEDALDLALRVALNKDYENNVLSSKSKARAR